MLETGDPKAREKSLVIDDDDGVVVVVVFLVIRGGVLKELIEGTAEFTAAQAPPEQLVFNYNHACS